MNTANQRKGIVAKHGQCCKGFFGSYGFPGKIIATPEGGRGFVGSIRGAGLKENSEMAFSILRMFFPRQRAGWSIPASGSDALVHSSQAN